MEDLRIIQLIVHYLVSLWRKLSLETDHRKTLFYSHTHFVNSVRITTLNMFSGVSEF